MGFFVYPIERPRRESQPAADYTPPLEGGYRPSINVHGNHTNLEGYYDPRRHLGQHLVPGGEDESLDLDSGGPAERTQRRRLLRAAIVGAVLGAIASIAALYLLYALFGAALTPWLTVQLRTGPGVILILVFAGVGLTLGQGIARRSRPRTTPGA